ncbi:Gp37 family protein [Lonsdalea quercina]|uniref:Gp37 family protein n=1 Tax=Lonsdalea quercina TaxID=71657 RepID=UPI00397709AC
MDVSPMIDAVVARIAEAFPGLQVESFPGKPAEYVLSHPDGAILVRYAGSAFRKPEECGIVLQTQLVKLRATVVCRESSGQYGAVTVLDALRRVLCGLRLPNCSRKIRLKKETVVGKGSSDGLWRYTLRFTAETLQTEDASLPDGPLLTQVTYKESEI